MRFAEFPINFKYERDKKSFETVLDCHICFEPYIEIVPHPELVGRSILITQTGIKDVSLPAAELKERFLATRR
jgi:hypothetical protein